MDCVERLATQEQSKKTSSFSYNILLFCNEIIRCPMKENIEDSERDKKRKSKEKKLVVDGSVLYSLTFS